MWKQRPEPMKQKTSGTLAAVLQTKKTEPLKPATRVTFSGPSAKAISNLQETQIEAYGFKDLYKASSERWWNKVIFAVVPPSNHPSLWLHLDMSQNQHQQPPNMDRWALKKKNSRILPNDSNTVPILPEHPWLPGSSCGNWVKVRISARRRTIKSEKNFDRRPNVWFRNHEANLTLQQLTFDLVGTCIYNLYIYIQHISQLQANVYACIL